MRDREMGEKRRWKRRVSDGGREVWKRKKKLEKTGLSVLLQKSLRLLQNCWWGKFQIQRRGAPHLRQEKESPAGILERCATRPLARVT
jgi:hypothetical protein